MWPKVSFLITTLNSQKVLEACLKSVSIQDYPKELIEIIISDGGSTDSTLEIAKRFEAKIVTNPLVTSEAGKMVALRNASGEFCALVDSDNELPDARWLKSMIEPLLKHQTALGSEPLDYILRPQDGFITRYCALMGMNDPLCYFLGNYDRTCALSGKWTNVPHSEQDMGNYLLISFDKKGIPTIGANGTIFRTPFLKENAGGDYLFDIDLLAEYLNKTGSIDFIKVKCGIIHSYCESNVNKFARKQARRIKDFLYHKDSGHRSYPWNKLNFFGYAKFVLYCVTVLPLILQGLKGYIKKKDSAWFFHVFACEITLWEYASQVIKSYFSKSEFDRTNWSQ